MVTFGSVTKPSDAMASGTQPNDFWPWNLQTMDFVASASTEMLQFMAVGSPSGEPPVVLLAGVSLSPVPEPALPGQ
jgi:hypothetical protein